MKRAHFICRRLDNAGQDGLDLVGHLDGQSHRPLPTGKCFDDASRRRSKGRRRGF
jgi:hypothetical protein